MNYPHSLCITDQTLIWAHVVLDLIIALAYFWIPASLVYLLRKIPELPHKWMVSWFVAFIVLCGLTHLIEVVNFWHAFYWTEAAVMAATALASMVTAVLIGPLIAQVIAENADAQKKLYNPCNEGPPHD